MFLGLRESRSDEVIRFLLFSFNKYFIVLFDRYCIIDDERNGRSRELMLVRKVRAPQGRMPDNVRRRELPGQCNRK